jgi:hypothetical protein
MKKILWLFVVVLILIAVPLAYIHHKHSRSVSKPSVAPAMVSFPSSNIPAVDPVFSIKVGDDYAKVIGMYGPGKDELNGERSWDTPQYHLHLTLNIHFKIIEVGIGSNPGAILCTQDGICLGKDTYADIQRISQIKNLGFTYDTASGEGMNILMAHLPHSAANPDEDRYYSWNADDEDLPSFDYSTDGEYKKALVRIFQNKPVDSYEDSLQHPTDTFPLDPKTPDGG